MLPPVILHAYAELALCLPLWWLVRVPNKECPRDFSQKSWFYKPFFFARGPSLQGPCGAPMGPPEGLPRSGALCLLRPLQAAPLRLPAFGFGASPQAFGLDFSWLGLISAWILILI